MSFEKVKKIKKWLERIVNIAGVILVLEILVVIVVARVTGNLSILNRDVMLLIVVPTMLVLIFAEILRSDYVW